MDDDSITALGMIGAWSQHTEAWLLDRIVLANGGDIVMSSAEASTMVEALNRLQEGLVLVINENA
ncbi:MULTISPECIES: hypothetical protein [Shinella]|uniref:hypothetical protein n=1 Tax=Shinella TaxID=323620 RepID=UPI001F59229A|nr:hypothetical protein [Shinella zoogloeoides]